MGEAKGGFPVFLYFVYVVGDDVEWVGLVRKRRVFTASFAIRSPNAGDETRTILNHPDTVLKVVNFIFSVVYYATWWYSVVSRKVSVSLPEKLLKRVDEAANRSGMSRSEFITRVLERVVQPEEEPHRYPTVLWKLQKSGYMKLRSPRLPTRIVGEWVVEEVEE